MPISKYYKGHGEEVMRKMREKYGKDEGESIFYATINARKKRKKKKRGKRGK